MVRAAVGGLGVPSPPLAVARIWRRNCAELSANCAITTSCRVARKPAPAYIKLLPLSPYPVAKIFVATTSCAPLDFSSSGSPHISLHWRGFYRNASSRLFGAAASPGKPSVTHMRLVSSIQEQGVGHGHGRKALKLHQKSFWWVTKPDFSVCCLDCQFDPHF